MANKRSKGKAAPPAWSDAPAATGGELAEALRAAGLQLPEVSPRPAAPAAAPPSVHRGDAGDLSGQGKLTVRREKAGRGGKTVTVIRGLSLAEAELETLCRALRKQLGTGATVQEQAVVLQGTLVERVAAWLEGRGARRVVRAA